MKFSDNHLGLQFDLHRVTGTDYWSDGDGDLYLTEQSFGRCYRISAEEALLSILGRESIKGGYCPICDGLCLKPKTTQFHRTI